MGMPMFITATSAESANLFKIAVGKFAAFQCLSQKKRSKVLDAKCRYCEGTCI